MPPPLYVGTKADLEPGDLIEPGVFITSSFDAAAWESEVTPGDGPGRIYTVEPTGALTDDPAAKHKKFPGPAKSYRTAAQLRVTGKCTDGLGHPKQLYHGTRADLKPGDLIGPGYSANFGEPDRVANHVYLAGTLDAAVWGAELSRGDGPGRIYIVEPTGPIVDDPNLTNKRFPGNPTKSYRSREPLRVTGEITNWQGHAPEVLKAMREGLERLDNEGGNLIDD